MGPNELKLNRAIDGRGYRDWTPGEHKAFDIGLQVGYARVHDEQSFRDDLREQHITDLLRRYRSKKSDDYKLVVRVLEDLADVFGVEDTQG